MQCEFEGVKKKLNFYITRQCKKTATVERDGHWYCHLHDPKKIKEREIKKRITKNKNDELKKLFYYQQLKGRKS